MIYQTSADWRELEIFSLLRSPFLFSSVLFHGLLFLLALKLAALAVIPKPELNTPISVQLLDVRDGGSASKSIGPGEAPGGPRTMPKLGTPVRPAQQTGKLDSGSIESSVASNNPVETAPPANPITLPGPKILAANTRESVNVKETSPDSLVHLPTKESPTNLPGSAVADLEANQRSLAALKGAGEGPGIKALKEGAQIPGALKGTGTGSGPYGVPGGSRSGTGVAGGGTGTGSGGGLTRRIGSGGVGACGGGAALTGVKWPSRNSAVILSSELDGTRALAMPSSLALARTSLLSIPSFFAMS